MCVRICGVRDVMRSAVAVTPFSVCTYMHVCAQFMGAPIFYARVVMPLAACVQRFFAKLRKALTALLMRCMVSYCWGGFHVYHAALICIHGHIRCLCVDACLFMHVCIQVYIHTNIEYTYKYAYAYAVRIHTLMHIHTHTHTYTYTCTCTCTYAYAYTYTHKRSYAENINKKIYTQTRTYICIS